MKKFLKKHLVFFIGIAVLVAVFLVFINTRASTALESGKLQNWKSATISRKVSAVKILTASDVDTTLLVQCVDKIAGLPDSQEMYVRDATELCFMGIKLKEQNTISDSKK